MIRFRLLLPVLLAAVLAAGCPGVLTKTDAAFVGDRLAARIYYVDRYERLCPHDDAAFLAIAPAGCTELGKILADWQRANGVAEAVIAKGGMPSAEKSELKKLQARAEKLP